MELLTYLAPWKVCEVLRFVVVCSRAAAVACYHVVDKPGWLTRLWWCRIKWPGSDRWDTLPTMAGHPDDVTRCLLNSKHLYPTTPTHTPPHLFLFGFVVGVGNTWSEEKTHQKYSFAHWVENSSVGRIFFFFFFYILLIHKLCCQKEKFSLLAPKKKNLLTERRWNEAV